MKNKQFTDHETENLKQIRQVTYVGMIVNILLSAIKFIFGILGSSQAVVADAIHSLSDMSTDFAILFGVKFWSAPADDDHPYGHRRIETIVTAGIGLFLVSVAAGIGYNALITIQEHHAGPPKLIAFWGAFISLILKELLYHWTLKVGRRVRSPAVIANAWHHRTDALSSIPVAVAVAAAVLNPKWSVLDHIGALVVSLFILKVAWDISKSALAELADRGASQKQRKIISNLALSVQGVHSIHALRTRQHGPSLHIDLHIQVDGNLSVRTGHDISEEVKKILLKQGPDVMDAVAHLEPYEEDNDRVG